ncbi:DUF192 domain-containing protein [Aciditerrimonas ferrireducens]|jgi:uncharacterized membrane protein (UPF0127 family)|uniref:DUF192 domain-containing protein n=1 Tax=Aciditerrimonas ferrireducens TaxID=667306 RepID=A0ABV6C7X8_9ACTN|nr:DUF192 domain-containing protein [Aciditerrimonas ferrireducens]MCK4176263.1 DUF192 domain-containing protein [Aciditerrimonas ferrireducens]
MAGQRHAYWLLRAGQVLASAEVAEGPLARWVGLLGRSSLEGALVLPRTRAVHTLGMRFAIDVAYLDRQLRVLEVTPAVPPWRIGRPRWCWAVVEAPAGAFERWGLAPGDQLELERCR